MKNLNTYITEKLKISKRTIETLSNEQLDMLFLYCMCYLGDEDLFSDAITDKWLNWGEMERYSYFGIDWYDDKHKWICEYGCTDVDNHTEISNLMDNFSESIIELLDLIIKYCDNFYNEDTAYYGKFSVLKKFLFYIMEYIKQHSNSSNIDLTIIDEIHMTINARKIYVNYKNHKPGDIWPVIIKDKEIKNACQKVYDSALELINK